MWVGISAAGVFTTVDGGGTWERRNDLADPADGEGHDHPAAASDGHVGLCVHHVEIAAPHAGTEPADGAARMPPARIRAMWRWPFAGWQARAPEVGNG